jgi:hypothetical protein
MTVGQLGNGCIITDQELHWLVYRVWLVGVSDLWLRGFRVFHRREGLHRSEGLHHDDGWPARDINERMKGDWRFIR